MNELLTQVTQPQFKGANMLQFIGVWVSLTAIAFAFFFSYNNTLTAKASAVCLFALFFGVVLFFNERATEITFAGVGKIKTATKEAFDNAKAIEAIRKDLEDKIAGANRTAEGATATGKRLEEQSQFFATMMAAIGGSRSSLRQLYEWAKDKGYPFQKQADKTSDIAVRLHFYNILDPKRILEWNKDIDPQKLSLMVLLSEYTSAPDDLRSSLVEFIWNRVDIPKVKRMEFLLQVMRDEKDLRAFFTAQHFFTVESKLSSYSNPEKLDEYVKWFEANKDKLK